MEPPVYCSGVKEFVFANLASSLISFEIILRPILDIMQTIPSFVYLIPVVI